MAEKGADGGHNGEVAAQHRLREHHRQRALENVAEKRRRGERTAAGAQHVGRADIARTDLADIGSAGEARDQQAERNGAAQIAENKRRGVLNCVAPVIVGIGLTLTGPRLLL